MEKKKVMFHEERIVLIKQVNELKKQIEEQREGMEIEHASKIARLKKSLTQAEESLEEVGEGRSGQGGKYA